MEEHSDELSRLLVNGKFLIVNEKDKKSNRMIN
jgi:hypothetical protein